MTPHASVDITKDACPMTYVRTKLQLEQLRSGEILEVLLRGDEPLKNVPRSARDEGHEVISTEAREAGVFRVLIRKTTGGS